MAACARALPVLAHVPLDVLDDDDGVVDDDAGGEDDAEERQRVDREVEELEERERADERHRNRHRRDDRAAPVLQEQEHHEDDEPDGFGQRLQHLDDRLADDADVVERQAPLETGREAPLEPLHLAHHALKRLERVGRRQQLDADAGRVEAAVAQIRRVGLGAELDAPDVADPHQRAVLAGLDDDVLELRRLGETAHRADADLEHLLGRRRRIAEGAGRHLQVLLAQRVDDVAGADVPRRQLGRIEPQAHRELALAEDDDVADAGHALDGVLDVQVDVVAEELRVVAVVLREEAEAAEKPGRVLRHRDAGRAHVGRHAAERLVDAILDVDRRQIRIRGRCRT